MPTVRVQPPRKGKAAPRTGGRARPKTAPQEVQSWLTRHRGQLWPFWWMTVVLLFARIVGDALWLGLGYAAVAVVFLASCHPWTARYMVWLTDLTRLDRGRERQYAAGLFLVAGAWSVWATMAQGFRPYAALPLLTALVSWPWWKHRSTKRTIPVHLDPALRGAPKRRAEARAKHILGSWDVITRQGKVQFAELNGLSFTPFETVADVLLRGGQHARSISFPSMIKSLESAFDMPANSLRVESPTAKGPVNPRAREVRLRFITVDRNAESLGAPPDGVDNMGRFETGGDVEFHEFTHTVVAGQTGGGKSGLVNQIIRHKAMRPEWAIIGVDLKPGALEFTPWEPVMAYLAKTSAQVKLVLEGLLEGMSARGEVMNQRGWREWHASPAEPNICLVIDEAQELRQVKGAMALLTRLAALSRAYGFQLVIATQYPKDSNLPTDIMAQVKQVFSCKLRVPPEDRVVFGENASAEGWIPSSIPGDMPGVFYVRSPIYTAPTRARGWWLTVEEVVEEATRYVRTGLDMATGRKFLQAGPGASTGSTARQGYMEPVGGQEAEEDIVDAVIVSEDPRQKLLAAIGAGHGTIRYMVEETGIPKTTVIRYLADFVDQGLIWKTGEGKAHAGNPWRLVQPEE